ncbi:MAG: glycoside hydrolase family 15 protein [Caulobacterales bacterium]|nr:glycoside hydrolase family 15 protein [Caulobacterales bacterium]
MTPPSPADAARLARLEAWRDHVETVFLARQRPVSGLLPASLAKTVHGDYTHAWVCDNVYSVLAVWALSRAYRRWAPQAGRAALLEQSTVKLMRGLLLAMMRQADKLERHKASEDPRDSLHAKYDADDGSVVVGDEEWGHRQLDATSLFLLQLAQMTASGLRVAFTREEVDFVQNLVHYVGPAYRIPDYGVWERGDKGNTGEMEINASSVGMAKAALEAMEGLNLFGADGPADTVIQVVPDEIARARETLHALLPLESASKETDAALLSVVGYPAYAVDDPTLAARTRAVIAEKLQGRYGCKRFLRDGHQTVIEDAERLHYMTGELGRFENIESEWPLFFAFAYADAALRENTADSADIARRLAPLFVEENGQRLLPELYYVPADAVDAEIADPGSQERLPNDNTPLLWAQSLYVLAALLDDGLVTPDDVDPLGRRARTKPHAREVAIAVIAQDETARAALAATGLPVQTEADARPAAELRPAQHLSHALSALGANDKLALTGRPARRLGALVCCRAYWQGGRAHLFYPAVLDAEGSYIRFDAAAAAARIRAEIAYVARHWDRAEAPALCVPLAHDALTGAGAERMAELLRDIAAGSVDGAPVRAAPVATLLAEAATVSLDHAPPLPERRSPQPSQPPWREDWPADRAVPITAEEVERWAREHDTAQLLDQLAASANFYESVEAAGLLVTRLGPAFATPFGPSLAAILDQLYETAGHRGDWRSVRRLAELGGRHDERLQDALKEIVVRLRSVRLPTQEGTDRRIDRPLAHGELRAALRDAFADAPLRTALAEEALLHLSVAIRAAPQSFAGCRAVRLAEWIELLAEEAGEGGEALEALPPHAIFERVRAIISDTPRVRALLSGADTAAAGRDWRAWRARLGVLTRVGDDFFPRAWRLLERCEALVIGDPYAPEARLDAARVRADYTPHERKFANLIEDRLSRIRAPVYRAFTLEAINAAATRADEDPRWRADGALSFDAVIHHAAAASWSAATQAPPPGVNTPAIWRAFAQMSPREAFAQLTAALDQVARPASQNA